MNSLLKNIFQLRRTIKTILQVFSDFILICFTFFLSMYLRLDSIEFASSVEITSFGTLSTAASGGVGVSNGHGGL